MGRDYYSVLGVDRGCSDADIKSAYRRLAMRYHPDRNRADGAEERFKEIKQAYETLGDSKARARYDARCAEYQPEHHPGTHGAFEDFGCPIEDIFGDIFGRNMADRAAKRKDARGRDLVGRVEVTLEQAVLGHEAEVPITRLTYCESCNGSGCSRGTRPAKCRACDGVGGAYTSQDIFSVYHECSGCCGAGTVIARPCSSCCGTGKIRSRKLLSVKIPRGVDSGTRIRLAGYGDAGASGSYGDLLVEVAVKQHPILERRGDDIHCTVPMRLTTALLGGSLSVPTIGGAVSFNVPQGTQGGRVFRVRGKGVGGTRSRVPGDLYVHVQVEVPVKLSEAQMEIARSLERSLQGCAHSYPAIRDWADKARAACGPRCVGDYRA
ncbi:molecular chaperone DnaJ [Candidatus Tremblaya princeps]|uniref:Chaperone protein DnaJ n=1 Tax=Tremblaya princeps TaxID=189385 RepID=A0A1C3K914_TREPR|nr:molecular chaperone DnaJ [Candidatus Tremblaya princeps]SBT62944.1 Chaperone protein DnaJ [Candidatus Tremblaya princeps]